MGSLVAACLGVGILVTCRHRRKFMSFAKYHKVHDPISKFIDARQVRLPSVYCNLQVTFNKLKAQCAIATLPPPALPPRHFRWTHPGVVR